jgi:hypothetical protein
MQSARKTLFIVPTDAHYYKIIEMLKQFKRIITLAPKCFGSRRNHHQGAVLCLAKTTEWYFRARRYRRSQCYRGISACCASVGTIKSVFEATDARCKNLLGFRLLPPYIRALFPFGTLRIVGCLPFQDNLRDP